MLWGRRDSSVRLISRLAGNEGAWSNPFVSISRAARLWVVAYFLLWRIFPAVVAPLKAAEQFEGLVVLGLLQVMHQWLLLIPFFFIRFAGTPVGWLHPLVLPLLVSIGISVVRDPASIFLPLTFWFSSQELVLEHLFLGAIQENRLIELRITEAVLMLIGQVSYLLGFLFYTRISRPTGSHFEVHASEFRIAIVVALCFLVFMATMARSGGILEHFSSLAYGRARMAQDVGPVLVLIRFLPYALSFWYLLQPRVLRTAWFAALFAGALAVTFIATGSRSGLFWPVVTLLASWMSLTGRVPLARIVLLGVIVFLSLGLLGELRKSAASNQGRTDFSLLTEITLANAVESTAGALETNRLVGGQIAVLNSVPKDVSWLNGSTYVGALLFFVPRSIWPEKPRGAGAYVGALIYEGRDNAAGYLGTGYPISAEVEAYWNFGIVGVAPLFLLFGLFHRLIARYYLRDPDSPFRKILLIVTLLNFSEPSTHGFVPYIHLVILLTFMWLFVGKRRRSNADHSMEAVSFRDAQ
jgi:oligosaccharide repeat unit polymerase